MFILFVSENILSLVCGLGILQGVLLSALVYFHQKSDRSVNIFLALYIFFTSVIMSMPFVIKMLGWQDSFIIQPLPFFNRATSISLSPQFQRIDELAKSAAAFHTLRPVFFHCVLEHFQFK